MSTVAIIEFDLNVREVFEVYLQDEGFTVFSFDCFSILPQLLKLKPDIIILDHFLHFNEANDFCSQLKKGKLLKSIPIILSSVDPKIEEAGRKLYVNAYLSKPIDLDSLKMEIEKLLN